MRCGLRRVAGTNNMSKRKNISTTILRTYAEILKITPLAASLAQAYYLIEGLFPAFFATVTSRFFQSAYNWMGKKGEIREIYFWGVILTCGYLVRYILQYVSSMAINASVYEKVTCYQKMRIGEKNTRISLQLLEDTSILNIQKRAMDSVDQERVSSLYMTASVFMTNIIGVLSVMTVLYNYEKTLVLISVISVLPFFITRYLRGKAFYKMKVCQVPEKRKQDYYWSLLTSKDTVKELKLYHAINEVKDRWDSSREKTDRETIEYEQKDIYSMLFCDLLRVAGFGISIGLVILCAMEGKIGIGVLGACISAFSNVQIQTKNFLSEFGKMTEYAAYVNDYFEFMDLPEKRNSDENGEEGFQVLEVKNLSFQYPSSNVETIRNVNLQVHKNEKVVIVGENGCGKTTLVKLILGFYSPSKGEIMWNNRSYSAGRNISMILQDFTKYEMSMRENVAISDIENMADDEKIIQKLKDINLEEGSNEKNLDEIIGRKFGKRDLSGGQWQKLAIARGDFKDYDIIFLDEPTSALDPQTEYEILKKFLQITKDKTAVIISHRVGLCRFADKVIMMQDGRIIEEGKHDDLIKRRGIYYQYYNEQAKWYS